MRVGLRVFEESKRVRGNLPNLFSGCTQNLRLNVNKIMFKRHYAFSTQLDKWGQAFWPPSGDISISLWGKISSFSPL